MKPIKKKSLNLNFKIYGICQFLQVVFSALCLILVFLLAQQEHVSFTELMSMSPISNMIYLVAMINLICFIELVYFKNCLRENRNPESAFVNIIVIALVGFLTLNMPVALSLAYFLHSAMKKNNLKIKDQFNYIKVHKQSLIPIINFAVLISATLICYKLLML